jgi:hypothetical protein
MSQPVYVLAFSEEQAQIMNAALARYLTHLKEHSDPEIRAIIPHAEELQQALVKEVRTPTIPYIDVKALAMLSQMNYVKRQLESGGPTNPQAMNQLFAYAHAWLTTLHSISVHFSDRDGAWHLGREDAPPSLASVGTQEGRAEQ